MWVAVKSIKISTAENSNEDFKNSYTVSKLSDVRPSRWLWTDATEFRPSLGRAFGGLGFAGQVLALALADAVKLLYINSNI